MSSENRAVLTPLAAAVSAALAPGGAAQAQDSGAALEEIIVTATKREQNLQEIPASIQAITGVTLEKMGAKEIQDYSRFIPSVNVVSYRPGSNDIIFRGVNSGGTADIAQSPASMYIDEMPMTVVGSQPDVRMVDIARVEALDGPQGTLFGGSAQSGTLRVITNQPRVDQFEAVVDVTLKQGPDTSLSHDVSGVLNLPIVEGKAALRLVGFTATEAGFIDNVFGHTPDTHQWFVLPDTWGVEDNADVVEDDWNGTDYVGGRASLRWEFNDDWAVTGSALYQKTEGHAGNDFDPYVGDLKTVQFHKEFRNDEWTNFALTVEGDLGWAQIVSATSYFDRTITSRVDNTVYTKYYQSWACLYQLDPAVYVNYFVDPSTGAALLYPRYCFGPSSLSDTLTMQGFDDWSDKFTQEVRLTGGGDSVNWIVGLFYEKTDDRWENPWGIVTNYDYQDSVALLYWEGTWGEGFAPDATHGWHAVSQVGWTQTAAFGEVTWRINDRWTAIAGLRAFDQEMESTYYVNNPNTQLNGEFVESGVAKSSGGTSDAVPKFSLSYNLSDNKMIYALYSEGFRPGGTNRNRGNPILPLVFQPDVLQNFEIGAKTIWADGRVRANLTYYDMTWDDYQLQVLDPSYYNGEVWQQVIANVGAAEITGVQLEVDVAVTDNLDFGMNFVSLDSKTASNMDLDGDPDDETPIEIPTGTRLPLAIEEKASAWLEYNWQTRFIPGSAFARLQWSHTGDSVNQLLPDNSGANPQVLTPSYQIVDFRVGFNFASDWQLDLFVSNLTDERAEYTRGTGFFELPFSSVQDGRDGVARQYTNRPREFGIRFSKRWSN